MFVPAAALAAAGMGSHHSGSVAGAFGINPAVPGTNSAGTALSSSGTGGALKGPALGTGNPAMEKEYAKGQSHDLVDLPRLLERFQAKWIPVRVKKTRQTRI